MIGPLTGPVSAQQAQTIEDLLARDVPIPLARPNSAATPPIVATAPVQQQQATGQPIQLQPSARPAPSNTASAAPAPAVASAAPRVLPRPAEPERNAAPRSGGPAATSGSSFDAFKRVVAAVERGDPSSADGYRRQISNELNAKTAEWLLARSAASYVGADRMRQFIRQNPGWPGRDRIRRNIERVYFDRPSNPQSVVSFFREFEPLSGFGEVAYARALIANGQTRDGRRWLRKAWSTATFNAESENKVISEFGSVLTRDDHFARASGMLYRERVTAAQRMNRFLNGNQRAVVAARAAVVRRTGNAGSLLNSVPQSMRRDPGYIFSMAQHLRRADRPREAANMVSRAPRGADKLIDTGEWWIERRVQVRDLIDVGEFNLAYKVAAEHSATETSDIREAEWHAGWVALSYTRNPRRALRHFEAMRRYSETPISVSRAEYWAGRAAKAAGNRGKARGHFRAAAKHTVAYYGQLAAAELGQRSIRVRSTGASRRADTLEPVRAADLMAAAGRNDLALSLLIGTSFYSPDAGTTAALAAKARRLGAPHLAVNIAKRGLRMGHDVASEAYPLAAMPNKGRNNAGVEPAFVYAIARQESEFRSSAVSPAGARGLMQLMPATARSVARETGLGYSRARLTRDPAYNMALGSAYLGKRIGNFGGSYIMAAAAYNAGKGRVDEWVSRFGDPRGRNVDPIEWVERLPFSETRNYVMRVLENTLVYRARLNGGSTRLTIEQDLRRGG